MAPQFTVLLPINRPPHFLPNAIEQVVNQTVSDFELFILCDGAPSETIECAHAFARRDPRVKVRAFPKGARHGEAHRHTVLMEASANFVAYLEDDDLWFSNHLEELQKLLLTVDFGHTIHVVGYPDGHVESFPCDIRDESFRRQFLDDLFNRFGYSFCGHRLDAYRRLPEGWAPAPFGIWNDLHMWRKFMRVDEFKFGTRMAITAVALPSHLREHMKLDERLREASTWISRIVDRRGQEDIVEAAWRSVMGKEIKCEQEIIALSSSNRETKAALAEMEAMHPGSMQRLKHAIAVVADAQLELGRLTQKYYLCQQALSTLSAEGMAQTAEIHAYRADLANLNARLAEAVSAQERILHSWSWRLTQPIRSACAIAGHLRQMLNGRTMSGA